MQVLAIDILRQQRAVSSGHDHTCRVWKVAEESQLIFRSHGMAVDCCKYITGGCCSTIEAVPCFQQVVKLLYTSFGAALKHCPVQMG